MTGGRLDWWDLENLWKFKGVNWEAVGGGVDRELDLVTVWRRQDVDTWVLGQLPHPGLLMLLIMMMSMLMTMMMLWLHNEDYLGAGLAAPPRGVFDRGRDILI